MQSGTRQSKSRYRSLRFINTDILYDDPWKLLRLYAVYRLILAGLLLLSITLGESFLYLGNHHPFIFSWVALIYFIIAIAKNLSSYFQYPSYLIQVFLYPALDTIVIFLLLFNSQGVTSGLAILLLIPVLFINFIRPGQYALFFSIMISLIAFGLELYFVNLNLSGRLELMQISLLIIFILITTFLAKTWVKRALKTANLVQRQAVDIANLSQLNQSIFDQLQFGLLVVESNGNIRQMNKLAWIMLNQPSKWRSHPLSYFAPEINQYFHYWLDYHCPKVLIYEIKHWKTTDLRVYFTQLGNQEKKITLIYLEDTSELKKRMQAAKLASLGQLTASIAHEIRNPLGAISHAVQLLSESTHLTDPIDVRMVEIMHSHTKRLNMTIESVLSLSRKKHPKQVKIHLKNWLEKFSQELVQQTELTKQQIKLFIAPDDVIIDFDSQHLRQVIWNLCTNAIRYAHTNSCKLRLNIQGGISIRTQKIMLNIIDNGKGIAKKNQQHLFEPFFTTGQKGTGLGLYMARELCLSNAASLEYNILPSGGSCFCIVFANSNN